MSATEVRRRNVRPAWEEPPAKLAAAVKIVVLGVTVLAILGPLWMILLTSLSSQATVLNSGGLVVIPGEFSLSAYRQLFAGGVVTQAIWVSILVTGAGTAISLSTSVMAAYALSKPTMPGHLPLLFVFLLTLFFSAGMIPNYLLISALGLIDNLWALILPPAVSAFNMIILRGFFLNLDHDLLDAARIDGAGEWRILGSLVVPLSKAPIAVVGLFYGVAYWNAFFNALLYIHDNSKWPLQLVLRSYVLQGAQAADVDASADVAAVADLSIRMAIVVCAVIPILVVYPFVQKYFKSGVLIGAVKG